LKAKTARTEKPDLHDGYAHAQTIDMDLNELAGLTAALWATVDSEHAFEGVKEDGIRFLIGALEDRLGKIRKSNNALCEFAKAGFVTTKTARAAGA
jgi:hypothetical protein